MCFGFGLIFKRQHRVQWCPPGGTPRLFARGDAVADSCRFFLLFLPQVGSVFMDACVSWVRAKPSLVVKSCHCAKHVFIGNCHLFATDISFICFTDQPLFTMCLIVGWFMLSLFFCYLSVDVFSVTCFFCITCIYTEVYHIDIHILKTTEVIKCGIMFRPTKMNDITYSIRWNL